MLNILNYYLTWRRLHKQLPLVYMSVRGLRVKSILGSQNGQF